MPTPSRRLRKQRPSLLKLSIALDATMRPTTLDDELARHARSERTRAVITRIAAGVPIHQVAAALGCSVGTVKADITKLYRYSRANDRQELLAWARRSGLLS